MAGELAGERQAGIDESSLEKRAAEALEDGIVKRGPHRVPMVGRVPAEVSFAPPVSLALTLRKTNKLLKHTRVCLLFPQIAHAQCCAAKQVNLSHANLMNLHGDCHHIGKGSAHVPLGKPGWGLSHGPIHIRHHMS